LSVDAVLVGGPGPLGHALGEEWLGRGHTLRALCAPGGGGGFEDFAGRPGFRGVTGRSRVDPDALRALLRERPEVCFCLPPVPAAGPFERAPGAVFVEWLGWLAEVAEACRAKGVRLVCLSSAAVLEAFEGGERQDESWPVAPRTPRDAALLAGEQLVLSYDRAYGLPVTVCRVFNVYGPMPVGLGDPGVIGRFALHAARAERLPVHGDGRQSRDFVHARDAARLVADLGVEPRFHGRVIHAASGEETRIVDLAKSMAGGAGFGFVAHPAPLAEAGRMRGDASLAGRLLKWAPRTGLREGLREMLAWAAARVPADDSMRAAS
jgi:nucleoside-diphosphate-sugar epimerase